MNVNISQTLLLVNQIMYLREIILTKRFAWSIGLVLSVVMFVLVVILKVMAPIKIAICLFCLSLIYFEAVFGICVGCMLYAFITKQPTKYCPSGVCEITQKEAIQTISPIQLIIVSSALAISAYFIYLVH